MEEKTYDYIVIGSGFGGSVSAMRLSEKGYDVLVLEKGREYKTEDFPKTNWNFKKFFWMPMIKWFGFQKLTFFKEVFVLSGVGVGGGSLVYANTHMVPPDAFFKNPSWAHLGDWKSVLMPFYEKAKFMLGTVTNTSFDREDEVLKEIAQDMGKSDSFGGVHVGVYFGDIDKKVDPYFKGLGPERKGCIHCAGCMVGCRYNAKNTLDKNYLWFAKKNGTKIEAERMVEKVEFIDGVYHIHTHDSTKWFRRGKKTFKSKGLVVSGGVLGTMDLLLKQKHKFGSMPNISDKLGENLRTNSESLCGVTARKEKLNHGVAITSVFNPDDHTHIEIVKYPDKSNAMKIFATMATGPGHSIVRTMKMGWNILTHPVTAMRYYFGKNWSTHSVVLLVMQTLDNSMKMTFKRFPFFRLAISNTKENRVPAYIDVGQDVMNRYAEKVDGIPGNALTEIMFNMSSTAHILGGCPMGKTAEEGVVNEKFQAFGYPNMYILDGSIIPGNLGVNPSLTITALSEYAMSRVAEKPGNSRVSLDKQLQAIT